MNAAESAVVPILVRANLSRAEWTQARQLALELNVSGAELVGRAVRELLALHGKPTEGSVKA